MTKKQSEVRLNKKPQKKKLIAVIIIAIVIGGGTAAYFATSGKNETTEGKTNLSLVGPWMDIHGVGMFLSGDDTSLYLATHNGLFRKEADGWKRVGNDKSDLMGFTIDRNSDNTMYSSGHPPGMGGNLGFRISSDGGNKWQMISPVKDSPVDFHSMTASASSPGLVYGSPGGGTELFVSHDGGVSWQPLSIPNRIISLAADPISADTVYAGTISGLFKSTDQGKNWTKLDHEQIRDLAVTGLGFSKDGKALYAFKVLPHGEGFVARSDDGGQTWVNTSGQIPDAKGVWNFAPGRSGEMYAITSQQTSAGIAASIYRSNDDGVSWTLEGTNNEDLAKSNAS
ncbi:MAG: hypothetical protein QXE84_09485 [Candidatus Nitrosotenuis sp.]